jgi:hypothetical protein
MSRVEEVEGNYQCLLDDNLPVDRSYDNKEKSGNNFVNKRNAQ